MKNHDPALAALVLLAIAAQALAVALRPLLAHALALLFTVCGWRPAAATTPPPITPTKEPPAPVRSKAPRRRTRKALTPAVA